MPVPYNQILLYFFHKGWVTPRALPPRIHPYPPGFDKNARCEYHDGSLRHTIDNYKALKYKVKELLDAKLLTFREMGLNVKNKPLSSHIVRSVNLI